MVGINLKISEFLDKQFPAISNNNERTKLREEMFQEIFSLINLNNPGPNNFLISNAIDLIHLTIVKRNEINDLCFDELKSIEKKINAGVLQDYVLNDNNGVWEYICEKTK